MRTHNYDWLLFKKKPDGICVFSHIQWMAAQVEKIFIHGNGTIVLRNANLAEPSQVFILKFVWG